MICKDKNCTNDFFQYNSLQKYCSPKCKLKNTKSKTAKDRKPIPKISKKQSVELRRYSPIRRQFMLQPENQYCPVTQQPTTEIHHMMGKVGYADDWARQFNVTLLTDERYFLAVSRTGHQKIENNPEWAKKNGYSLNRIK